MRGFVWYVHFLCANTYRVRTTGTHLGEASLLILFLSPSEKGSTTEGKYFLPWNDNAFLFE